MIALYMEHKPFENQHLIKLFSERSRDIAIAELKRNGELHILLKNFHNGLRKTAKYDEDMKDSTWEEAFNRIQEVLKEWNYYIAEK